MSNENAFSRSDANLTETFALGAVTGTAATDTGFDLGSSAFPSRVADVEFELAVPALPSGIIPNGGTVEYRIEQSDSPTFSTIVNTPAFVRLTGSSGTSATTIRGRSPSNGGRYVRANVNINVNATTGGATAATYSATFSVKY